MYILRLAFSTHAAIKYSHSCLRCIDISQIALNYIILVKTEGVRKSDSGATIVPDLVAENPILGVVVKWRSIILMEINSRDVSCNGTFLKYII